MTLRTSTLSLAPLALLVAGCGADQSDPGTTQHESAVSCEGDLCVLSGTLTEDLTLTPDKTWLLRGGFFIGDDVTRTVLTIEAGTTIYGETSTQGMLVVRRGSWLQAEGTAQAPIVFTSSKEPGSRSRGDWGGLIINGRAPVNGCQQAPCESYGEGGTGFYGGDDPHDSSGVLRYLRVEFAGKLISPDNELNGIAFQGVGDGTVVDYIQVHMNKDDGVEFFGGTVNVKHLLLTGIGDDALDWTDGWRGKAQFVVAQQYEDAGDNGIEADNNAENNDAAPRSLPTLSNVTLIGSPDSAASDLGLLLREGTGVHLHNAVVVGFNEACLDIDDPATFAQHGGGQLTLAHTLLSCATQFLEEQGDPSSLQAIYQGGEGNRTLDPQLTVPYGSQAPDFRPGAGSPALGAGVPPSDAFFEQVDFIGAVGPELNWTAGWTIHERS